MKKLSAILIVLVLAFFIYQYFGADAIKEKFTGKNTGEQQGGKTSGGTGQKGTHDRGSGSGNGDDQAANLYAPALSKIHAAVFAKLNTKESDPIAGMRELADRARASLQSSPNDEDKVRLMLKICSLLARANSERTSFKDRIKSTQAKDLGTISGDDGAARRKKFILDALHQNWQKYVSENQPVIERLLAQLRKMEAR